MNVEDNTLSRCAEECGRSDCVIIWLHDKWENQEGGPISDQDGRCCLKGDIPESIFNNPNILIRAMVKL